MIRLTQLSDDAARVLFGAADSVASNGNYRAGQHQKLIMRETDMII